MSAGARAADSDVLWFLDADTRLPADAPAALLTACRGGGIWGRFDVRLSGRQRVLRVVERLMNLRSRLAGVATGDQGILVTRPVSSEPGASRTSP